MQIWVRPWEGRSVSNILIISSRWQYKAATFIQFYGVNVCLCVRALEMLQQINQSVTRSSSYSQLAMTSLLSSNLSVKYSLTGRLASTDIIKDGFYDAGKVVTEVIPRHTAWQTS